MWRELVELREQGRVRQERQEALEKEHEDLLICLAEQDEELSGLKEHILALGISK